MKRTRYLSTLQSGSSDTPGRCLAQVVPERGKLAGAGWNREAVLGDAWTHGRVTLGLVACVVALAALEACRFAGLPYDPGGSG